VREIAEVPIVAVMPVASPAELLGTHDVDAVPVALLVVELGVNVDAKPVVG
jgi:hypothetical protein